MELQVIQSKIHEIRGHRVMLDSDLAKLYGTETKRLKEAVKRNIKRFPSDFMFELNKEEWENLRTQIATSKRGGIRYRPFAFTEQGVAMLSSVLGSDRAIEINIGIMRAFVSIRQFLLNTTTTTRVNALKTLLPKSIRSIKSCLRHLRSITSLEFFVLRD